MLGVQWRAGGALRCILHSGLHPKPRVPICQLYSRLVLDVPDAETGMRLIPGQSSHLEMSAFVVNKFNEFAMRLRMTLNVASSANASVRGLNITPLSLLTIT